MWEVRCPYCSSTHGRCAATSSGRSVTECCSCGRVIGERQTHTHPLFLLRAIDTPLPLVTPDLHPKKLGTDTDAEDGDEDPFHPTGFITAFSTWSLESTPVFARSSSSFSGHLAELERALDCNSNSSTTDSSGPHVSVDNLRAYLQILDVASILGLDHDIADHAFELFKDCSSTTCLRNRSVEALATAALVQAIREAQEPRTLQEISTASNLPQKEIGKYIKILGEALKLSQPLNSNSISVHMPRFCTLLQLNKSAQELAAHIGEVVINKCFCTRRNPISISAAAIYLACQLEDKRKTQAEICKVTGLTEVTLRKVYKELLENWNDLLPPNYTPAVPPERAFPMTAITSGRSAAKVDLVDLFHSQRYQDKEKPAESIKQNKTTDVLEKDHLVVVKEEEEKKNNSHGRSPTKFDNQELNQTAFWQPNLLFGTSSSKADRDKDQLGDQGSNLNETKCMTSESDYRVDRDLMIGNTDHLMDQAKVLSSTKRFSNQWQLTVPSAAPGSSYARFAKQQLGLELASVLQGIGNPSGSDEADGHSKKEKQ